MSGGNAFIWRQRGADRLAPGGPDRKHLGRRLRRMLMAGSIVAGTAAALAGSTAASANAGWSAPKQTGADTFLESVSCASLSYCVTVGGQGSGGIALTYDGTTWSAPQDVDPTANGIVAVSCPSPSFCLAGDEEAPGNPVGAACPHL